MATAGQQVLVSGLGGQGVLFATSLVLEAARAKGMEAIASETHGMAQRGGSVVSHIKLGSFLSPLVRSGSADLLLSLQREEAFRNLHFIKPGGTVVVNAPGLTGEQAEVEKQLEEREIRLVVSDATEIARSAGTPRAGNVAMLGVACSQGVLPLSADELRRAIETLARGPRKESNLKVFDAAVAAGRD